MIGHTASVSVTARELYESFAGPCASEAPFESLQPIVRRQFELMAERRRRTACPHKRRTCVRQGDTLTRIRCEDCGVEFPDEDVPLSDEKDLAP